MNYTPGPWINGYGKGVTGPTAPVIGPCCAGERWPYTVVSKDMETIAIVPKQTNGIMEANARLIAAAPELLEACKEILDCQDHFYTEHNGTRLPVQLKPWAGPLQVIFETAREAIAKAEGRDE